MRNQNRRRNPDMEAYRSWQSDRSDRGALQRYLLSMDRGREVMSEPEDVIDLESRISLDDPLRQVYERVRLSHPNNKKQFKKNRWESLVKLYAGQQIPPQSVLILIEIGLRSGLSINDVYKVIHENKLISDLLYERVEGMIGTRHSGKKNNNRLYRQLSLPQQGEFHSDIVIAIPQLVYSAINDEFNDIRISCATELGKIGRDASTSVFQLADMIQNDDDLDVRLLCIQALGNIGPSATYAVPRLIESLMEDEDIEIRLECAIALGKIGPSAASAVPYLMESLEESDDVIEDACRTAIEQITGESPQ